MQTDRSAVTRVPISAALARRWSPRSFDPDSVVSAVELTAVLEAARWSATWGARQPVRFVAGLRGDSTFGAIAATLRRGNSWALACGALILVSTDEGDDENTAYYAAVDAGAAVANATTEAVSRGLVTHPMAGFDSAAARDAFAIPAGVRPVVVLALGTLGGYDDADPRVIERDTAPRQRRDLAEVAFQETWATPLQAVVTGPAD